MVKSRFSRKPRKCPNCGHSPIASILYGMPDLNDEMQRKIDEGRLELGGCCVGLDDPVWKCSNCGMDFFQKPNDHLLD